MNDSNFEPEAADDDILPLRERIKANPGPAVFWLVGVSILFALQFGMFADGVVSRIPWEPLLVVPGVSVLLAAGEWIADLPVLLSKETVPNQGYYVPGEGWQGTFLGLSPAAAWAIRVVLVYAYAFVWVFWIWKGYLLFRTEYRYADWTPRDDMINRMRTHRWGQFGLVIVILFLVMALFAPVLAPTTFAENIDNPYGHQMEYYDESVGNVVTITVGEANQGAVSRGAGPNNVGPLSYDDYDRFAPFGTLHDGKDLFTFMAFGARVSLAIGILTITLAGVIAASLALATAYYKGRIDLSVVLIGDSVQAMPRLLLIIMLSVVLGGTWLADIYSGGFILALIFAATGWPGLWRSVRGPAFQVAEQEWIDAAKSYGQGPGTTMKKHMLPYILGYLLVYSSMSLGGVIVGVAGLSFLGLGVNAPTPEWGRAIDYGQAYVASPSWHISLLPGFCIVLIVTAFNALGDGIRDAIDPQSQASSAHDEAQAGAAGGGA
ncbi:ABC transporter permease [Natrononativus amylolyticus]|uniref:ABC transporter permease n=1 Tax=Natrononativus amylolyticus TaxID=2963434 RepID=UPI0020CE4800|nr:ABC transporter permease [Natrononativus amylolyticus]